MAAAPPDTCAMPGHTHAESCQTVYWPRRLHALGGAAFAVFLSLHFFANATAWDGTLFGGNVGLIRALHQSLPCLIGAAIFLPLASQVITGGYLLFRAGLRYDTGGCTRNSPIWRYFLQRLSAAALLLFVFLHLGTLHDWGFQAVPHGAASDTLAEYDGARVLFGGNWWTIPLFLAAVALAAFHLANGAISGARVWGLFTAPTTTRRWQRAALAFGLLLAFAGLAAVTAFARTIA